jgi:hypothetical protein
MYPYLIKESTFNYDLLLFFVWEIFSSYVGNGFFIVTGETV